MRVAAVWNVGLACNVTSADLMISSPLVGGVDRRMRLDYGDQGVVPAPEEAAVS